MRHGLDRPLKASIVVRPGLKLSVIYEGLISLYASSGSADVKYYKSRSACGNEREQCSLNQL
jgi:hypothetical protein